MLAVVSGLSVLCGFVCTLLLFAGALEALHDSRIRARGRMPSFARCADYLMEVAQDRERQRRLVLLGGAALALPVLALSRSFAVACLVGGLGSLFLLMFPRHLSKQKSLGETERAIAELPDLIDIVSLAMSAGVSFDAALDLYCSRVKTSMSADFDKALKSWRLGMVTREEALKELAGRYPFEGMRRFCDTVVESLRFGSPLVAVLEEQSRAMRAEHQSYVQEKIERAPVKMLVPIGVLILPAMLLAILGPLMASALMATS